MLHTRAELEAMTEQHLRNIALNCEVFLNHRPSRKWLVDHIIDNERKMEDAYRRVQLAARN